MSGGEQRGFNDIRELPFHFGNFIRRFYFVPHTTAR
jgi:hypothetical protein